MSCAAQRSAPRLIEYGGSLSPLFAGTAAGCWTGVWVEQRIRPSLVSAAGPGSAPGRVLLLSPNRTQSLVLGFFLVVLASAIVIRVLAPEVYDRALRLPAGADQVGNLFLAALTAFLIVLAIG